MLAHPATRYLCYAASAMVGIKVFFHGARYARDLWKNFNVREPPKIMEVLFSNELSYTCANLHTRESGYKQTNNKNGQQIKSSNKLVCKNPYCSMEKIRTMIKLFDEARFTIDVAMFLFSSMDIANALKQAAQRGVSVRIITDDSMIAASNSQIAGLSRPGVSLRAPEGNAFMHHKFCIIDGPNRARLAYGCRNGNMERSLLINGSLNWTNQAFHKNFENILISSDKALIEQFETEFERMFKAFKKIKLQKIKLHSQC